MHTVTKLSPFALALMLGLNGCAIGSIDLTEDRTITIVKSPYLINVSGDIEETDKVFITQTLSFLHNQKFRDYNFTSIEISVTGSETDRTIESNDNLVEYTKEKHGN